MLHREIDDLELKMLEAGEPTVLTPAEQVEGLIKRLRRVEDDGVKMIEASSKINERYAMRIQELEKLRTHDENMRKRFTDEAAAEVLKRGGPSIFNRWRNWAGTPFDMSDVCAAICEALTRNGVIAWNGDGVSIVGQMVEAGHRRAEKAEKERDEFKSGVMAVHELCDRAEIPHELEKPDGVAVLVTELPAWKRVELLVTHWQNRAMTAVNPMVVNAAKLVKLIDFSGLKMSKKSKSQSKPTKSRPRGRKVKTKR